MDGGNRSYLAPKFLAIPLALCLIGASWADENAAPSDVRPALALGPTDAPGAIQQVVGKQPGRRRTRPIASAIGSGGQGSTNTPIRSILGGLFGGPSQSPQREETRPARPVDVEREPADWTGIPYHQATSTPTRTKNTAPIRDPRPGEARVLAKDSGPRVSSTPSTGTSPSSARRAIPKPPALAAAPERGSSTVSQVPTPGPSPSMEPEVAAPQFSRVEVPRLSSDASSRRRGRRDIPSLDASEIAAASKNPSEPVAEDVLVPKVVRRQLTPSQPKGTAEQPKASPTSTVAKSKIAKIAPPKKTLQADVPAKDATTEDPPAKSIAANDTTESSESITETPAAAQPATPSPQVAAKSVPEETAVAAVTPPNSTPSISSENPSVAAQPDSPAAPVAKLSTPTAAPPQAAVASTPTVPTAPAAIAVSQRSGPPASDFDHSSNFHPRQPAEYGNQYAGVPNGPVGSGVPASPTAASGVTFRPPTPAPAPSSVPGYSQPPAYTAMPYQGSRSPYVPAGSPGTPRVAAAPAAPPASFDPRQGTYPADPYARQVAPPNGAQQPTPQQPLPNPSATAPRDSAPAPAPGYSIVATPQPLDAPTPVAAPSAHAAEFNEKPFAAAPQQRVRSQPNATRTLPAGQSAVASELPGIRVVTHGPSKVMIRQTNQFEIRVENRGSIDATGVMVRAVIPDWAVVQGQSASRGLVDSQSSDDSEKLVWQIDSLPAGTSEKLFVRLKAERSGTHGLDVDWTLVPQKSITQVVVREPQLNLLIEGPESVVYGESQTYRVRVLNPGDGIAPNVVFTLSPNSPTPQTQRIGDIPSGKEAQFEVELTAQDLGDLKIHGLASGDLELHAEASKTIKVSAAELSAVMNGPEVKYQDTEAVYNLQLLNEGDATSKNIVATLSLPAGAKYLGGLEEAKQRGSLLTWTVDALAPGAVRDYQFRCMMNAPGEHNFAFECTGTAAGQTNVALATRVESIADLVLTIQDPVAPAPVGSEVVYEILIRNRGSKDANGVRAIAQFSHGIEPRRVEGHSGEVLTGQVLFDPIPVIAAGGEARLRVVAEAGEGGHHRFRTEIRSGETVLVAEEATHYMSQRSDRVSRRSTSSSSGLK